MWSFYKGKPTSLQVGTRVLTNLSLENEETRKAITLCVAFHYHNFLLPVAFLATS